MKIIDKYIYKALILPSVFGISIFTFILIINVFIDIMEKLFTNDLPFLLVIDYFIYLVPGVLTQTIPMGAFLGVMLTYGNFSETNELIAIESAGTSLFRITRPAIVFGIMLTVLGLFMEIEVNPRALNNINIEKRSLFSSKPSSLTEEKVFLSNSDAGFGFYVDEVDNSKAEASKFVLFQRTKEGEYPTVFFAEKARFEAGYMLLKNVEGFNFDKTGDRKVVARYEEQYLPMSTFFKQEDIEKKSRSEMNLRELKEAYRQSIAEGEPYEDSVKYMIKYNERIIGPFASVLLCWLGVLLAVSNKRSGKGISFGISLIVIFVYIGLVSYAKIVVQKNHIDPNIAMWMPNFILLVLCLVLSIKKSRSR